MAKKTKKFKLGPEATLFVDPTTKLKMAGKGLFDVTPEQQSSDKFKIARKNNHVVEPDDDDFEEEVEDEDIEETEVDEELAEFEKLKVDDMKDKLEEDFELTSEEIAAIKLMKKADLIEEFKRLNAD